MPEKTYGNYEQVRPVMNMMNKNSLEHKEQTSPVLSIMKRIRYET
jgi:hypothetical protein